MATPDLDPELWHLDEDIRYFKAKLSLCPLPSLAVERARGHLAMLEHARESYLQERARKRLEAAGATPTAREQTLDFIKMQLEGGGAANLVDYAVQYIETRMAAFRLTPGVYSKQTNEAIDTIIKHLKDHNSAELLERIEQKYLAMRAREGPI